MSSIKIKKIGITKLSVDAIVNAANEGLLEGGGVCGAIFREAGSYELTKACQGYGHCKTGNAVITPGFALPAKNIIHAVGPIWNGGNNNEPKLLYSAYKQSLILAKDSGCHSIAFPLISAGIFGYPKDKAWRKALQACLDFINANPNYDIDIIFAVLDDEILNIGQSTLQSLSSKGAKETLSMNEAINIANSDANFAFVTFEDYKNEIPLGKYRHFKGNEYEVIGIAKHSETEETMVVYRALYGDYGLWVRPAKMWLERVEINGETVRRFEKVPD